MIALSLDDPRWAAFVEGREDAKPYHHPAWARLLAETYGFRGFALAREEPGGRLVEGLPLIEVRSPLGAKRWISLPFTDDCAPMAGPDEGLAAALDAAREGAGIPSVEVRAPLEGAASAEVAVSHALALEPDPDALFRRFNKSQVQRGVKRAEKEPLTLRRGDRVEDLTEGFYRLHLITRRRQGTPIQPRRFFRLLWERLLARELGWVSLVEAEGRAVAAAVFLSWNGTVIYKYGASDPSALSLRPNHLLFWDTIRSSAVAGAHTFDFGRTDFPNEGLRAFKSGWGAEERPLVYSMVGAPAPSLGPGRARNALSGVIRRSPPWVCRGVGELLYKYAA